MKIALVLFFLISNIFAYEKAFIDTHGGKKDPLVNNNSKKSFSSVLGSLLSDKKEVKENSNIIKIDKIEKIDSLENINKDNK